MKQLGVKAPCTADWEGMEGDERIRYCPECRLNVYNFAEWSNREIAELVAKKDGRLCARMLCDVDGAMLTRSGSRRIQAAIQRVSRLSGVAMTLAMGILAGSPGATVARTRPELLQIQEAKSALRVNVVDAMGAAIGGAKVSLTRKGTDIETVGTAGNDGTVELGELANGTYYLTAQASGFARSDARQIVLPHREEVTVKLLVVFVGEVVGISRKPSPESSDSDVASIAKKGATGFGRLLGRIRRSF